MKEHSFDNSVSPSVPPVQPHFDDELTIAFARPVVPLEKISTKERHRRQWILGGAFAIAMMLGAASALLAAYVKLRNVPGPVTQVSEVQTPEAPVAPVETVASQLPMVENGGEVESKEEELANPEELTSAVTPKKSKPKVTVRYSPEYTRPRVVRETDEADELNRVREAVLFDAWQERRARRVARRERRNRVDHHDRDLSNLDEIFEGPRRRRPY